MDLYTFDINDFTKEEYDYYYSILSEKKRQRVDRVKIESNKKSTVVGEMLVRKAISKKNNIPEREICFFENEKGKPYVKGYNIFFNISHSYDMVACAISDKEIGIDIERIRPIDLKIAKRVCLENELDYIFDGSIRDYNSTDELLIRRFFEIWTGKEAYFKYIGTGITDFKTVNTLNTPEISKPIYKNGYIIRTATQENL